MFQSIVQKKKLIIIIPSIPQWNVENLQTRSAILISISMVLLYVVIDLPLSLPP